MFKLGNSDISHVVGIDTDYARFTWYRDSLGIIRLRFAYGFDTVNFS
jgi:hypothetical protein